MHQGIVSAVSLTGMHKIQIQNLVSSLPYYHRVLLHNPAFRYRGNETLVECLQNTGFHDTDRLSTSGSTDDEDIIVQSGLL